MTTKLLTQKPDYLYRSGIGIMLLNNENKIFVGRRVDNRGGNAWQMPQGGIDEGEEEDYTVFRELEEETGIKNHDVSIICKSNSYHYYNLPYFLQKKFWDGKFLGQKQRWYLMRFHGDEKCINIETDIPEFCEYRWVETDELLKSIVAFKRKMYQEIVNEFKEDLVININGLKNGN